MKTTVISLTLISSLLLCSFKLNRKADAEELTVNEIEKSVSKISNTLYAGKYEVSNEVYRAFENELRRNNKAELLKVTLPDSQNWTNKDFYNVPYVEYYYRHPAYRNYPMVNVSYEAANLFCQWLTDTYNQNPRRKFKKVLFRLPTQKEWEVAAKAGNENAVYSWGNTLIQNNKPMCNYLCIGEETIVYDTLRKKYVVDLNRTNGTMALNDNADVTAPVASYQPNKLGIYNMCGNVAEMVDEKGMARGGSYRNPGGEVRIESISHYQKSASNLGFRYFMEVKEM
jgi:formylglycine-generating enzyme required for sulfatase activity